MKPNSKLQPVIDPREEKENQPQATQPIVLDTEFLYKWNQQKLNEKKNEREEEDSSR